MYNYRLCLEYLTQKSDSWLFWLQPIICNRFEEFDETKHENLLIIDPVKSDFKLDDNFFNAVPDLVSGLKQLETQFAKIHRLSDFVGIFQNTSLIEAQKYVEEHSKDLGIKNPFQMLIRIEKIPPSKELEAKWAQVIFYKAIYLYLHDEDRYQRFDADIALVYCVWQLYNLLKKLWSESGSDLYRYELAKSYIALDEILSNDTFYHSIYMLWHYGIWNDQDQKKAHDLTNPIIRERLRLSMVLKENQDQNNNVSGIIREKPIDAPFCFQWKRPKRWKKETVKIHPRFSKNGSKTVCRLIKYWLLPRYDIGASLRLAINLAQDRKCKPIKSILSIIFILIIASLFLLCHNLPIINTTAGLLAEVALPIIFVLAFINLDRECLFEILLPRLFGGIVIGYLAFTISKDGWRLPMLFCCQYGSDGFHWQSPIGWWLLVLILFSIVFAIFYFYKEAFVYTNDRNSALFRTLPVMIWTFWMAISIGAWVCEFASPIFDDIKPLGLQGPLFKWNLYGFLGKPIPIIPLLTFVTLSVITGIIVQIIWEDKPVTASIWSREER